MNSLERNATLDLNCPWFSGALLFEALLCFRGSRASIVLGDQGASVAWPDRSQPRTTHPPAESWASLALKVSKTDESALANTSR